MTEKDDLRILLTNDDGIDAPGIKALYQSLSELGQVQVLAPESNQSAVGRSLSYGRTASGADSEETGLDFSEGKFSCYIPHTDNEIGYAVRGTPCDCVILGINAFDEKPDLVVSGCNSGANLGTFVLSRSGTASAAMEAAYLGLPAVAVSMNTLGYADDILEGAFRDTAEFTKEFIEFALTTDCFDYADYVNINTPRPECRRDPVEITRPTPVYEMDASFGEDRFYLQNRLWEQMATGDLPDPAGTDRRAIHENAISISPLRVPIDPVEYDELNSFVDNW